MKRWITVLITSVFLTGCMTNPVNVSNGRRAWQLAQQAEAEGNFEKARKEYEMAALNAEFGVGIVEAAYSRYNYARMNGYVGRHKLAEQNFRLVLKKIENAPERLADLKAPTLGEFSRYLFDTGNPAEALKFFPAAVAELEKVRAEDDDPIGFAEFLDDYSAALAATGQANASADISARASAIKDKHPGVESKFKPRRYSLSPTPAAK